MKAPTLETGLKQARVLVCAGTGGVGKTTVAAALGIQAALEGRRTLVITIDPARRLADALGLASIESTPTAIDLLPSESLSETPAAASLERATGGRLDAVMLDPKPTFDRLITRLTDDLEAQRRILDNRIYRHLSEALAGSAEYAAMEQVHEFVESGEYDLVVVDTPPSSHALDFLRAPRRLREFLESRFVKSLVRPAMSASRFGFRFFSRPLHRMFSLLERIAGVGFLDDLSEFLSAIDGLSEGFRDRATRIEEVLSGQDTNFVLVCGAVSSSGSGTLEFLEELDSLNVQLAAVVVNRVRPWPLLESPGAWRRRCTREMRDRDEAHLRKAFSEQTPESQEVAAQQATSLIASLSESARICEREEESIEALNARAARRQLRCHLIPELPDNLDRFAGLLEIGSRLRAPEPTTSGPG